MESAPKRRKLNEGESRETLAGIGAWLNPGPAISVIFKARVTDFCVDEIALDGKVAEMTDKVSLPVDAVSESGFESWPAVVQALGLSSADADGIPRLCESKPGDNVEILCEGKDKEWRRSFHQAIRQFWPQLSSETVGDKAISVVFRPSSGRNNFSNAWPQGRPKYLRASMRKWNRDTTDALQDVCRALRVKSTLFSFAGTKDKRGVTTQHITAWKLDAKRLRDLNGKLRGIEFGNFSYVAEPLGLGDLSGNRFHVILRRVEVKEAATPLYDAVEAACSSISTKGFINFFGLQRFGTGSVLTHHVGRALLKGDWKEAVELIMLPRPGENEDVSRARAAYAAAPDAIDLHLSSFPRQLTIERMILEGLHKSGATAYLNAIQALPRPTRLLYLHAYQSFVWNSVASQRVLRGPLHPIPGDLIKHPSSDEIILLENEQQIANLGATLLDVVLPLPGHSIKYPANEIANIYNSVMLADGLDPQNMERKISDFSLPGSYRALIVRPKTLSWKLVNYSRDDEDLSGLEKSENSLSVAENTPVLSAVDISFDLPSSAYATMLLREICKTASDQWE